MVVCFGFKRMLIRRYAKTINKIRFIPINQNLKSSKSPEFVIAYCRVKYKAIYIWHLYYAA